MNTNHLEIKICSCPEEAPNYSLPEFQNCSLLNAVIVRKGTVEGNSTVDLVFEDETGKKFITMTTGRIIKMLAGAIGDEQN